VLVTREGNRITAVVADEAVMRLKLIASCIRSDKTPKGAPSR